MSLPRVIILDEPELGLHPAAISSLAGMIRTASVNSQVILATQSPRLVDEFNIDEIVIVERDETKDRSLFKRLDEKDLSRMVGTIQPIRSLGKERSRRQALTFIRLHVTSEGQTEEAFVRRILAPHSGALNVFADARSVLTSKDRKAHKEYRGGLVSYTKAKADIETWMKEDGRAECRFTTMFDLYALPVRFSRVRRCR